MNLTERVSVEEEKKKEEEEEEEGRGRRREREGEGRGRGGGGEFQSLSPGTPKIRDHEGEEKAENRKSGQGGRKEAKRCVPESRSGSSF